MFSRIATKHIPQNQHEFSSKSPFSANYKSSTLPFDKSFVKIKQEGALRKTSRATKTHSMDGMCSYSIFDQRYDLIQLLYG